MASGICCLQQPNEINASTPPEYPARVQATVTFALLAVILAWSAYALLARRIYDQVDEELQDRAIAVRSMLQIEAGNVKWLNAEADPEVGAQFEHSVRYYELLDEEGRTLASSRAMSALHLPPVSSLPISVQPDHTPGKA